MPKQRDGEEWRSRLDPEAELPADVEAARDEIRRLREIEAHRDWVIEGLREHVGNLESTRAEADRHIAALSKELDETRQHARTVVDLLAKAEARSRETADAPARVTPDEDIIRRQIEECRDAHDGVGYYGAAEEGMDGQWAETIFPMIRGANFDCVLELAPGHGRNTAKLIEHASEIHLVDVNKSCIAECKKRFGKQSGKCALHYHVNDGRSLEGIASGETTFIYSWDAVVHFDRRVVREYVQEFARILAPGGTGFIHHSNFGVISSDSHWLDNPSWRSNMTRELFAEYCEEAGLEILEQKLLDWHLEEIDCISLFRKPA